MICKRVKADMTGFAQVESLQQEAFPPQESYSMEQILSLSESDQIEYMSFWEEGLLHGLLFYDAGVSMLYLFYLAVNRKLRSRGIGGKLLSWLKEKYPDKSLVANIEPVGMDAANEEQRVKRLAFYERNGFHLIPYRLSDDSGLYDIIMSGEKFDEEEYMHIIEELGFGAYHPHLHLLRDHGCE